MLFLQIQELPPSHEVLNLGKYSYVYIKLKDIGVFWIILTQFITVFLIFEAV
jgi:hypothetical protein